MPKKNYKTKRVRIPIYTGFLAVFIFDDLESLRKVSKSKNPKVVDAYSYKHGSNFVLCISRESLFTSIIHETVHLTNLFFEFHGIELDLKNDENQAYVSTWFYEEILTILKIPNNKLIKHYEK